MKLRPCGATSRPRDDLGGFIPRCFLAYLVGRQPKARKQWGSSSCWDKNMQKNSPFGFSLIELLLVIVILGVIAGFAIPNFSQTYANLQLQETAKNMAFLMRYVQSRAIVKQKSHRLEFNADKTKYWISQEISQTDKEKTQAVFKRIKGKNGRVFKIPEGVTVVVQKQFIEFYPDGEMDKEIIYIRDKKKRYFSISTQIQAGYVMLFDFKVE